MKEMEDLDEAECAEPVPGPNPVTSPAGNDMGTSDFEGCAAPETDETSMLDKNTVNSFTHDPETKHKGQLDNGSALGTLLVFIFHRF